MLKKYVFLSTIKIILIFLILCVSGCSNPNTADEAEFLVPVSVTKVGQADVEDKINATGTLRVSQVASLEVETGGVLEFQIKKNGKRLREGDKVKAGDVIAMITGEDVRLAANTKTNYQKLQTAKEEYESKKSLFDEGFESKSEILRLQSQLEDARVAYERSLNSEKRNQLVTPIDGVILRLARDRDNQNQPLAVGQYVDPGIEVARIAPTDLLVADVDLVAQDVARVKVGLNARIKHYAWEGEFFKGEVTRLAPVIDPVTRALRAEVEVDNSDGRLRPGMFVEVIIVMETRKDVPVVPRESVINRGGKSSVFVLKGQRVALKNVTPGLGDDDFIEIREGLSVGERVVTRGMETLIHQARVRVTGNN
ncbi:efflux RND transporter periplasmic adaptor subunit [Thermodesulfobacteriota bacterium]